MNLLFKSSIFAAAVILSHSALLFAAPEISVDSADFDMGIIREGSQPSIKHEYKIKNTGDQTLKISRVKPSCGCTAVGHDSIIEPGKTGKVTAEVNLTHFRAGPLKKYVTVFSNAKTKPELALSLACVIRSDLNVIPSSVRLVADKNGNLKQRLTLIANKSDLVVEDVSFIEDGSGGSGPAWQEDLPIGFSHTLTKTDRVQPDGFFEYTLDISLTLPKDGKLNMYGRLKIKTNHPTKSVVDLTCSIEPAPNRE